MTLTPTHPDTIQLYDFTSTNDLITRVWDIGIAMAITAGKPSQPFDFVQSLGLTSLNDILNYSPDIDASYASLCDCTKPILVVQLPCGAAVVIDGWHRIYRTYAEGRNVLPFILLSEHESNACLVAAYPINAPRPDHLPPLSSRQVYAGPN